MIEYLTPSESGAAPNNPRKPPTISLVHPRSISEMMVARAPPIMKGLRLPQRMRQLSLSMPTYGCTRVPESGPAIQTKAMRDLLRPRDSRYGEPLDISTDQAICKPPMLTVRRMRYQMLLVFWCSSGPPAAGPSIKPSSSPSPELGDSSGECSFSGYWSRC